MLDRNARRRLSLGLALAAGCASDSGGGTEPLPPCEDYEQAAWDCAVPSPCPDAVYIALGDPEQYFEDRAAAVCVAEALRDRRPARLQLNGLVLTGDGSKYETIFVLDDVHAVSNREVVMVYEVRDVTNRQLLQPPEYFENCLTLPTDRYLYECLDEWSMGCGEEPVACP